MLDIGVTSSLLLRAQCVDLQEVTNINVYNIKCPMNLYKKPIHHKKFTVLYILTNSN